MKRPGGIWRDCRPIMERMMRIDPDRSLDPEQSLSSNISVGGVFALPGLGWLAACGLVGLLALAGPATAVAEEGAGEGDSQSQPAAEEPEGARPSLGLDSLLRPRGAARLPAAPKEQKPGGRDRETWTRSFAEVRSEIQDLESSLDKARDEVSERSGQTGYQYSPIGGEAPSDPEILKLRAQMRRDKKSLEAAKSRLRDLQVEAALAGVPEEWTQEP